MPKKGRRAAPYPGRIAEADRAWIRFVGLWTPTHRKDKQ